MKESAVLKSKNMRLRLVRGSLIEKLKNANLADIAHLSGAVLHDTAAETGSLIIEYLGKPVAVDASACNITAFSDDWYDCGGELKIAEEIFILHYLLNATGKKPTGNFVPFRSMDGGLFYDSVFKERATNRLVRAFLKREEQLLDTGALLGGIPFGMADLSVTICVLPNIKIVLLLWKGDEELPSSGNILFDDAIIDYLPTEDSVVLAENVVSRIVSIDKK